MATVLMPTHTSCVVQSFGEISNLPGDSDPLQPRFGTLWLLAFPKTKIIFEREEISGHWWDSGKYHRVIDGDWENCVRFQGVCFEGDWGIIVLCTMFLVHCVFSNKCLFFILCGWIPSGQAIYVCTHTFHFNNVATDNIFANNHSCLAPLCSRHVDTDL